LVEIVKKCFKYHAEQGEKVPIPPEEAAGPEIWSHLTEAERKMRKETYDKTVKNFNDVHIQKKKTDCEKFHELCIKHQFRHKPVDPHQINTVPTQLSHLLPKE